MVRNATTLARNELRGTTAPQPPRELQPDIPAHTGLRVNSLTDDLENELQSLTIGGLPALTPGEESGQSSLDQLRVDNPEDRVLGLREVGSDAVAVSTEEALERDSGTLRGRV